MTNTNNSALKWFLFLIVLNILDVITTLYIMEAFGTVDVEANPIVLGLINLTGTPYAMLYLKAAILAFLFAPIYKHITTRVWVFVCGVYAVVVTRSLFMCWELFNI